MIKIISTVVLVVFISSCSFSDIRISEPDPEEMIVQSDLIAIVKCEDVPIYNTNNSVDFPEKVKASVVEMFKGNLSDANITIISRIENKTGHIIYGFENSSYIVFLKKNQDYYDVVHIGGVIPVRMNSRVGPKWKKYRHNEGGYKLILMSDFINDLKVLINQHN